MQTFQTQNMQVSAIYIAFERIGKLLESVFAVNYVVKFLDTNLQVTTKNFWAKNPATKKQLFSCASLFFQIAEKLQENFGIEHFFQQIFHAA